MTTRPAATNFWSWKRLVSIIKHPLFLILCISLGIYVGFYHKQFVPTLEPIAKFYTNMLQITVIPIISITILTNMIKPIAKGSDNAFLFKTVGVFVGALFLTGIVAVLVGYLIQPGEGMATDPNIMKIVEESGGSRIREITLDDPIEKNQSVSIVNFLIDTVPHNIFESLSSANMLQIIVFCVLFSVFCGLVSRIDKKERLTSLGNYLPVLYKINEKVLFFLPFGSFCLLATQLSNTTGSALVTILNLALTMLTVIIFLTVVCSVILWRYSGKGYLATLKALFETIIMAFSTQSSIVCVPRAVEAMTTKLGFDRQKIELTIPLGVPLCQFSTICFYVIGSVFIVNIFNEKLDFAGYAFVVLASVLTSFAASGVKGVIYYSLMGGILAPLGVPLGNAIALFIAVDPLVDPFGTVFHMYATCCAAAICSSSPKKKNSQRKEKKAVGSEA